MKNNLSLASRLAAITFAAALFCRGGVALAQETDASPSPADTASSATTSTTATSSSDASPQPGKAGADEGAKSSKAESAKQKSEGKQMGAALADADKQFMQMAAKDGMREVHMGQMAVQQGQSDEVKKLGKRIVADHTKANNQLMAIAAKRGMKLDTRHKMDKMSKKEMENFDQAWLDMMVNDHVKDIATFDKQAKSATDPEVKAFAGKTLPVLKKHLQLVKAAQKKMGKATSTASNAGR